MKGRKLLAGFLSAAMVLGTMSFPVFAESDTYMVDAENSLDSVISQINTSASGNVVINLNADANFSFGARTQIGNENTTSITIDGGNNVLNLIGTDTDWSSLGNAGGKLVFKNVTINKTEGGNGAWNNHAFNITSYVEFDKVTVNNAVTIHGGGKFTNTNFYEAGEYYTLYIPAVDQDVVIENCNFEATNSGRGIKVIEQYVSEAEKAPVDITVTGSTFKTAKKAAILVTSTEGANIIASGNNIEEVAADSTNLVWVDSDLPASYPKVLVTIDGEAVAPYLEEKGIGVACIGNSYYMTLADAVAAAQNGDVVDLLGGTIVLKDTGVTTVPINKNITITNGTFDITDFVAAHSNSIFDIYGGAEVKFEDVDFTGSNYSSSYGVIYAHETSKVTLNNCDFELDTEKDTAKGGVLKGNDYANDKFVVNNCNFTLNNTSRVFALMTIDMNGGSINATHEPISEEHAFRNVYGTIDDATISFDNFQNGIKNTENAALTFTDSNVTSTNMNEYDLQLAGGATVSGVAFDKTNGGVSFFL